MQKFSMTVFVVLVALAGWARADLTSPVKTSAESAPDAAKTMNPDATGGDDAPDWRVGQLATVQGLVRFEERHTIIPMLCFPSANPPCARSRPYWSAILYTDTSQYEIDERFAMDQTTPPDSVNLAGQTIRAGQVVKVQATVEYAVSGYYILGDVRNAAVVLDYSTVALPNWSCHGMIDRDTEIQAEVTYTGASGGSEGDRYALKLSSVQDSLGHRFQPLVALADAQGFTSRNQLVYQGENVDANIELVIGNEPGSAPQDVAAFVPGASEIAFEGVPGHLKFSLSQLPGQEHGRIQPQGEYTVLCTRTR